MIRRTPLAFVLAAAVAGSAPAATFTVDSSDDLTLPACTPAPADCSLRGAIAASNAVAGAHRIEFAIPLSDPGYQAATQHWRIDAASAMTGITSDVVIDGFTQPGALANGNALGSPIDHALAIELRGPNLMTEGLTALPGSRVTLRGIALTNFNRALYLFAPGPYIVAGNHFGVDTAGLAAPNRIAIVVGGDVTIGGVSSADANVIAANRFAGISQQGSITRLRIQRNFIGVGPDGSTVPGLQDDGIQLVGSFADALIGGDPQTARNVISGNAFFAVYASGQGASLPGSPQLRVQGNYFGTSATGQGAVGNGLNPGSPSQPLSTIDVFRAGACGVQIGGTAPGQGNLIAHSGAAGVKIGTCREAEILGNVFRLNRGLPIDTSASSNGDGTTPNDAGDADDGGNRLQNGAHIDGYVVDTAAGELRVTLRVDSTPAASAYPLRLDFHRDDIDGLVPIATETYALADAQQLRTYVLPLALAGKRVQVAVTDADGNSGELVAFGELFADGFESL